MKVPLKYQNTEYDCGTTSFVNALAYLYDREEIPVELLKSIYRYTLDVENEEGIVDKGGTSKKHAELLSKHFVKYANENKNFNINCEILRGNEVKIEKMKRTLENNGVIIARCSLLKDGHYIIIAKIIGNTVYIFDPYYIQESYFDSDGDVELVLHKSFSHNRLVNLNRLFDERQKDYSLFKQEEREVILITR